MRLLLIFCLALPLRAGWNYSVLSGATEGTIVSRLIMFGGDVPQERTYVAYRDASGSLAVARYSVGFTTVTVWPGVGPSSTFASLIPKGTLLVTFWNNNKYRFAMSVANNSGNCGPSLEYRCGDGPLPAGQAPIGNNLYSVSRSATGAWITPARRTNIIEDLTSRTNYSYGPTYLGAPADGWVTGVGPIEPHYIEVSAQVEYSVPTPWKGSYLGSERRPFSRGHCPHQAVPDAPLGIQIFRRDSGPYSWAEIFTPDLVFSATNWCDISVNNANTAAVVSFTSTVGAVTIARSPVRGAWDLYALTLEAVDATSTFSRPQIAYRITGKLLLGYQSSGFFKLAVRQ